MKSRLRRALGIRRNLHSSASAREKSRRICLRLAGMPEFRNARTVMFYLPIKKEVDTSDAIRAARKAGKRIAVPAIEGGKLVARDLTGNKLRPSIYGVSEPVGTRKTPNPSIDLVVVPGIAFDLHGGRIGYGKGYYDFFLKKVPAACKVGLAYDFQILGHFPKEPHDVLVDQIVTEKRMIDCTLGRMEKMGGAEREKRRHSYEEHYRRKKFLIF